MAPNPPENPGFSGFLKSILGRLGSVQMSKSVNVEIRKNVKIIKIVNGKPVETNDPQGLLSDEILGEIASQIGMSVPELQQLIDSGQVINTSQLSEAQLRALTQQGQTQSSSVVMRPATMIDCPKCKRKTPQTHHSCVYCGELLAQPTAAKQSINEVDKNFLESDVKSPSEVKEPEIQPLHDTFKDRLKDL